MKHMKLIALLAAAMMVQPVYAGKKMDGAKRVGKKTAKGTWHVAQTVTGVLAVVTVYMIYKEAGGSSIRETLNNEKFHLGLFSVGAITLLNSGLRGLNREFKIVERTKKIGARIMKRKK